MIVSGNGALFSDCGNYRYRLWRIWDDTKPLIMFIGLNPSTANASTDDPTIRKIKKVAAFNGFGGFYMMNLFGIVSANPEILLTCTDPIKDNNFHLDHVSKLCSKVCFCWGNFKQAEQRSKEVVRQFQAGLCFIQNKNGSPKHPLYCLDETVLIPFKY